jgi:uncharacterized membrane protein YkgB
MKLVQNSLEKENKMNFMFFISKDVGINLNQIEWYIIPENMKTPEIMMVSGMKFFIYDADDIAHFIDITELEFFEYDEDENEAETE